MIQQIRLCLVVLTVLALTGFAAPVRAQAPRAAAGTDPASVPFLDRTGMASGGPFNYQVFVPAHLNRRRAYPVILFLHGSGERGDDNRAQTKNGIRLLIGRDTDRFPCVVVCPQCRAGASWTDPEMEELALAALDQSVKEFHGDLSRIYLTGLSMGGYGTWDLAQRFPARWAAIAPCCGGRRYPKELADPTNHPIGDPYLEAAQKIVALPAWVFHGGADGTVPVSESRQMVALLFLLEQGRKDADLKYSEYPGVGHNSWDYAYKEPDLLPWMLSHRRPK